MKSEKLLQEIRETNLSFLLLAQNLLKDDRAEALYRLGVNEEVAEIIEGLTTAQMLKIASTNTLLCSFRFDDEIIWRLLTSHSQDRNAAGIHAAILMAGKTTHTA